MSNSSVAFRMAAAYGVSPTFMCPPGPQIIPLSDRLPQRILPSFTANTLTPKGISFSAMHSSNKKGTTEVIP